MLGGDTYWGARVWVPIRSSSAVKRAPAPLCGKTPTAPGRWAPARPQAGVWFVPCLSGWIPPSCPAGVRAIVLPEDLRLSLLVSSPSSNPRSSTRSPFPLVGSPWAGMDRRVLSGLGPHTPDQLAPVPALPRSFHSTWMWASSSPLPAGLPLRHGFRDHLRKWPGLGHSAAPTAGCQRLGLSPRPPPGTIVQTQKSQRERDLAVPCPKKLLPPLVTQGQKSR